MRAILRVVTILAAGLWLAPVAALAQNAAVSNTPAPESVGPSELQNFSLNGSVTRPADQRPPATTPPRSNSADTAAPAPPVSRAVPTQQAARQAPAPRPAAPPSTASDLSSAAPSAATPQLDTAVAATSAPAPFTNDAEPAAAATLAPPNAVSLLPWLAAALALIAGAGFLLWLRRSRAELASGPQFDILLAPEPQPEPVARPTPPRPVPPKPPRPAGIVASRLRPSLELAFRPLRCLVEDERVTIEFELELFNSGTAPARAVLAEASLLNAGATEDQELGAFFANPHGVGERLTLIAPMKRVAFTSQVVAPRAAVQEYELAGRKAFVPVIAFNALYQWSGGSAQTSAAFLVGKTTGGDKLGPLRMDQGSREYHGLGARPLPTALRT